MPKQLRVVIVILVLAGLAWYGWNGRKPEQVNEFSGWLEGEDYRVVGEIAGKVNSVYVKEGQEIKKGQAVAKLDAANADILLLQAKANLAIAQAKAGDVKAGSRPQQIAQAQAQVTSLQANLTASSQTLARASQQRNRIEELVLSGAANQDQLDAAKTTEAPAQSAVDAVKAQIKAAQNQVRLLQEGATSYNISASDAQVLLASRQVEQAQLQVSKTLLTAPVGSRVEEIIIKPGELAAPGAAVVKLIDDRQIHVTIFLPQSQLGQVRVGQKAVIQAENGSDKTLGKVVYIAAKGEFTPKNIQTQEQRATQVFEVKVALEPLKEANFKPGQTVTVRLD
ncbi:MAG TPA: HlyD family efflux transporter periplasmic adaptor subunit [Bacillota bacterium]|nr:HlyD family efflux transporter periplasmic adaptor subunit [Bacillota bacterium]